jgi:hypothetical protein
MLAAIQRRVLRLPIKISERVTQPLDLIGRLLTATVKRA